MKAIPKVFIASIVLVVACLSMATTGSALSLQVRGGTDNGDTGKGSNVGLDLYFYEGRSFDFFVGYDRITTSDDHELLPTAGAPIPATTDATTTALILSLRYKMQTESSWKPFLSFGVARLDTKFTHQPGLESYYEQPFKKSSTGTRLGLGVDVGISDDWSCGLEGSLLTGVPYYEEYFFGGGRSLDNYGIITQLNIGLRYHFN